MLYSTIVQRDESGLNQIYEAAKEFEDLNVLEAIVSCHFDIHKVRETLCLVRMYQNRLNIESMELAAFSENFIEEYATDNNKCFQMALRLVRKIGTTITGSMKIFRKYCPVVRKKLEGTNNVVPVLDYSRLTFRQYYGQLFGVDPYVEDVKTLLHEQAAFFYHLVTVLALCKDMIRQEEEVKGDFERLKKIFEKSCDEVLHGVREVFDTFGQVKLISDEELAERRKNARPLKDWLAKDYHAHDKQWLKRESFLYRLVSGCQYGLDEKASVLWAKNPEWGRQVCDLIPQLDSLNIPFKHSKKAEAQGKKGTFDAREMAYLVKWSGVSSMSDDGKKVIDEPNEKQFYLYLQNHYKGEYLLPTWQAVCRERSFCYRQKISMQEMANNFSLYLSKHVDAA
ncbi:MAG: hypothetical protein IJV33_01985 [Bacteroidaceae bacterium]|nr:hypothetical protein [Bacteroidaceae bacterium]